MQSHWVGYFFEHGAAEPRAELIRALILRQLGVGGAAAANAFLARAPGAAWADVFQAGQEQQERHRTAVRERRQQELGAASGSGTAPAQAAEQEEAEEEGDEDDDGGHPSIAMHSTNCARAGGLRAAMGCLACGAGCISALWQLFPVAWLSWLPRLAIALLSQGC